MRKYTMFFKELLPSWLFSLLCFLPLTVAADSFYSAIGLGLPRYAVSQKASGMGGAGIGVSDRLALNTMNPAANNVEGMVSLGISLEYEYVENKTPTTRVYTGNGNAAGMQFFIPVYKSMTLITMLRPLTMAQFATETDLWVDQDGYRRKVQGSGGISAASLGVQYLFKKRLSLAMQADLLFGSYNEEWKYDFVTADYRDTNEKFNSFLWGVGFDAGAYVRVAPALTVGFLYRSGAALHLENRATLGSGKTVEPSEGARKVNYPHAVGAGLAFEWRRWLWAMDYFRQFWQNYKVDGIAADLKPYQRLSSGIEYQVSKDPFDRYFRRIAYRVGVYHAQLPFVNSVGDAVHETFFSIGLGLPFSQTVGRVDLAVEFGQRGDTTHFLYQDKLVRLSGSIVAGERWFQRRY